MDRYVEPLVLVQYALLKLKVEAKLAICFENAF